MTFGFDGMGIGMLGGVCIGRGLDCFRGYGREEEADDAPICRFMPSM